MVKKKSKIINPVFLKKNAGLINFIDLKVTIIILFIITIFFYETKQFDEVSNLLGDNIRPETFPKILIAIIALMSLYLPFENNFLKKQQKDLDKDRAEPILKITWITIGFLIIATIISTFLGIVLTMSFVCLGLPLIWGEKNLLLVIVYSIIFPILIYLVFQKLLGVYLEPGILGIIF